MRVSLAALLLRSGKALLSASLMLAAGGLAAGCSGAHEPAQQAEHAASRRPARPVVNVPAMLGKPINSLRQHLEGNVPLPAAYRDANVYAYLDAAAADSIQAFRSGRLLLLACYDIPSRRVHDLLLLGRHEDSLMQQAALSPNVANYLVLPIFQAKRAGSLLGLRVVDTKPDRN